MTVPYQQPGLTLSATTTNDAQLMRALQTDLRALGYLTGGIDGKFGMQTKRAVRALQFDLINNRGDSRADDGRAPVAMTDYNHSQDGSSISSVTGVVDQTLVACMVAILSDSRYPRLPCVLDPSIQNGKIAATVAGVRNRIAPTPFMLAIFRQESGLKHFCVPQNTNSDNYIVTGLDRGDATDPDHITSRGYGVGQYTLFHHPARADEVTDVMEDPVRNVTNAYSELRDKFNRFLAGPADRADDRAAEHPLLPLRTCKYAPSDARYLADCRNCALQTGRVDIFSGKPVFAGSTTCYRADQYYASAQYRNVPDRSDFPCDWPYAVRRYNGGGMDSYHYQTRVLLNLVLS